MKKLRFVFPVMAFLFAVVAAFATKATKSDSAVDYYFKNASGQCEVCPTLALPANVEECQEQFTGEVCKCMITNTPDLGIENDPTQNCVIVSREE